MLLQLVVNEINVEHLELVIFDGANLRVVELSDNRIKKPNVEVSSGFFQSFEIQTFNHNFLTSR